MCSWFEIEELKSRVSEVRAFKAHSFMFYSLKKYALSKILFGSKSPFKENWSPK